MVLLASQLWLVDLLQSLVIVALVVSRRCSREHSALAAFGGIQSRMLYMRIQ